MTMDYVIKVDFHLCEPEFNQLICAQAAELR